MKLDASLSKGALHAARHPRVAGRPLMVKGLIWGLAAALLPALGGGALQAATHIYTNTTNGSTTQWSAGTNWDVAPVSASDTALVFGNGATLVNGDVITSNNDVANPFSLNALTINYAGSGAGINSSQVVITGGTLNFVNNGVTGPTLNLNATGTVGAGPPQINTVPRLDINSAVTLSSTLTITGGSNAIINGVIDGAGGITKNSGSGGTVALVGANTYTGVTTINSGSISVRNNLGLGSTAGGTVVNAGGAVTLMGGVTVTGEALFIDGNGAATEGALRNESGNNTWAGDITVGTAAVTRVVSSGGTLTISGNVAISTVVGNQFVLQGVGNGVISGNISGAGRLTKSVTGSGTWTLSGTNTYSGITTISGGTLHFAKRVSLYNADTTQWTGGNISVAAAGFLGLNVGGAGEFTAADLTELQDANFAVNAGLTLDTTNASGALFDLTTSLTNTNLRLVKIGSGVLVLSTANFYNGSTAVSGGTLRVLHDQALGTATGATAVGTGFTLELAGGRTITGETLDIVGGGVASVGALYSSSGNNVWNGNINANTAVITRVGVDAGSSLTVNGNITNTGTATSGLVFQGPGTVTVNGVISGLGAQLTRSSNGAGLLVLTGANTYTGNTIISNGTIQVGVAGVGSLGATNVSVGFTSSSVRGALAGTGSVGGLVTVANGAILSPGDSSGAGAGTLTLGAGLTLASNGGAVLRYNLATPGTSDKIVITNGVFTGNSTGTNTFEFTPGVGFDNGTYDLIDWSNVNASATGVSISDFTYTFIGGDPGKIVEFQINGNVLQVLITPEPGRAVLMMMGLMGLVGRRRRSGGR